jgi:putative FmdB family regulatory protein
MTSIIPPWLDRQAFFDSLPRKKTMPIYEFYCEPCNTLFNFFSRSVNTETVPDCPRCSTPLKRRMSMFACTGKAGKDDEAADLPVDEAKLTAAMDTLTVEAEHMNEDDPRQAVNLMRKFTEMTGVKLGDGMQEALRRMEEGEEPDSIEADIGDALEQEDPFALHTSGTKQRHKEPRRDETLYEL